jgi:predicted AlkP superfamily phosphohydrolase/phosphomutase
MAATLVGQLGRFDWPATRAFHGLHSDVWLNLEGREPQGVVDAAEAPALLEELKEGLAAITDPSTGEPVFGSVRTRDELYSGPQAALGPDLMLDSWSAGYRVAPGHRGSDAIVVDPAPLAGVEEPWSADHRPLGIFVGAGPRIGHGSSNELNLYDVAPTALALLEQPVPEGLDGRVVLEALVPQWLQSHPIKMAGPATRPGAGGEYAGGEYSEDEAAAVASHLKDLGYIE